MKKILFYGLVVLATAGCADNRPMPVLDTKPVTCSSEAECSYLWSKVPQHLEFATKMRVESANDTFITTFIPIDTRQLAGRASKVKQSGDTAINAEFQCHRHYGQKDCERAVINATNFFNQAMSIEKKHFNK
ncbi:hypothetical protein JT613_001313 [Escherichia coli]|nr:hypothetical protein [Escherichia coli]EHC2023566.1 hypothetical protein [Escherichia coli]EID6515681.1 hypothetical protein [Escherichia coli]EII4873685.1 hypothetical protein [Escherichia coli]EJA4623628.1 hypothetical protein [Escherichia coli]